MPEENSGKIFSKIYCHSYSKPFLIVNTDAIFMDYAHTQTLHCEHYTLIY